MNRAEFVLSMQKYGLHNPIKNCIWILKFICLCEKLMKRYEQHYIKPLNEVGPSFQRFLLSLFCKTGFTQNCGKVKIDLEFYVTRTIPEIAYLRFVCQKRYPNQTKFLVSGPKPFQYYKRNLPRIDNFCNSKKIISLPYVDKFQ